MNGGDIASTLEHLGVRAQLSISSAKVRGFQTDGMRHPVYLKLVEGGGMNGSIRATSPLVVHPECRGSLESLPPHLGIQGVDQETFGSTFHGFPRKTNRGRAPIAYGIPLKVPDLAALEVVLACLGFRHSQPLQLDEPVASSAEVALSRRIAEAEVDADPQTQGESPTTRKALVDARIGQGKYRREMEEIWGHRCAVTGCSLRPALIASHAKPWAESTNAQRLDPYNGLLLSASIDRLFDSGRISFADDGTLLLASGLPPGELALLGLTPGSRLRRLPEQLLPYLEDHRRRFSF